MLCRWICTNRVNMHYCFCRTYIYMYVVFAHWWVYLEWDNSVRNTCHTGCTRSKHGEFVAQGDAADAREQNFWAGNRSRGVEQGDSARVNLLPSRNRRLWDKFLKREAVEKRHVFIVLSPFCLSVFRSLFTSITGFLTVKHTVTSNKGLSRTTRTSSDSCPNKTSAYNTDTWNSIYKCKMVRNT